MRTHAVFTATVAGLALGLATPAAAQKSLTAVSWGGAYTKSQIEAYHKPYSKMTGVTINSEDYNGGLAQVKAQVQSRNVTWDVVDVELSDAESGCADGLFEKIDPKTLPAAPDGTPAVKDFIPGTLHECGIPTIVWSTIYAYDKTKFPQKAPSTIADLFDAKNFPGKRGLRKVPKVNLEFALMADGVAPKDVYKTLATKAGVDRAFAKLDAVKPHVVWWEAGAQPPQMLADGQVAMATAYNGRIFEAQVVEKKPFVIVWDGQVWDIDLWSIPKGSKNRDEALKFVVFSTDTQRLADQARWISYGPARLSSVAMISTHATAGADMKPHMPTAPDNFKKALQNDFKWWADHQNDMNERFNNWLAK
jgi:putative spermidine/putrescine transport system substrate-binding protein